MNSDLTKMRQATAQVPFCDVFSSSESLLFWRLANLCIIIMCVCLKVLASQKQLENKYKASKQSSDDWFVCFSLDPCFLTSNSSLFLIILSCNRYKRAQLALAKGDEDLAREALKRRKSFAVGFIGSFSLFSNFEYALLLTSERNL